FGDGEINLHPRGPGNGAGSEAKRPSPTLSGGVCPANGEDACLAVGGVETRPANLRVADANGAPRPSPTLSPPGKGAQRGEREGRWVQGRTKPTIRYTSSRMGSARARARRAPSRNTASSEAGSAMRRRISAVIGESLATASSVSACLNAEKGLPPCSFATSATVVSASAA